MITPLLKEIRHNPLLWLLVFIPVVFAAQRLKPDAHTLLFGLSVLAIVPLAALLSHATESVAAKTGDTVGGLLNATLGNLTELIIALAALRAGEYTLVKASIAGAIVTNTLFMLGASFLLGGLKHHVQEFNRVNARLQAGLLFLATVALLVPSAVGAADPAPANAFVQRVSLGLSVLLIAAYGLGLLFTLKTHREIFGSAEHGEADEAPWPLGLALATLAGVTVLVALVSEVFVESVQDAALDLGMTQAFVGFIVVALVGGAAEMASAFSGARKNRLDLSVGHRVGERVANRAVRGARARADELRHRPGADEPAVLAGRGGDDLHRHDDRVARHEQRPLGVVHRRAGIDGVPDLRDDAVPAAAADVVTRGVPGGTLASGSAASASVRVELASARHRRRHRADDDAGAGRHRVRGSLRRSRHLRPVRHDRPAPCVCDLRPEPDPGARARTPSLAAVILAVVLPLSAGNPERAVAVASTMAIVSGLVCVGAGLARLGFITELLSKPIRYGYMNGIALTVLLSQLPKLFGFSIDASGPGRQIWAIGRAVLAGQTNGATLGIGAGALALILLLKRRPQYPGDPDRRRRALRSLVAALDLSARAGVSVLGPLPRGLPAFTLPLIRFDDLAPVLIGGVAVALVSFADTSVLSRVYAAKLRTPVDPNQEMVGPRRREPGRRFLPGIPDQQQLVAHARRGGRRVRRHS